MRADVARMEEWKGYTPDPYWTDLTEKAAKSFSENLDKMVRDMEAEQKKQKIESIRNTVVTKLEEMIDNMGGVPEE